MNDLGFVLCIVLNGAPEPGLQCLSWSVFVFRYSGATLSPSRRPDTLFRCQTLSSNAADFQQGLLLSTKRLINQARFSGFLYSCGVIH